MSHAADLRCTQIFILCYDTLEADCPRSENKHLIGQLDRLRAFATAVKKALGREQHGAQIGAKRGECSVSPAEACKCAKL